MLLAAWLPFLWMTYGVLLNLHKCLSVTYPKQVRSVVKGVIVFVLSGIEYNWPILNPFLIGFTQVEMLAETYEYLE